jgi:hypothetical protein
MVGALAGAKAVEGLAQNKATPYVIGGVLLLVSGVAYFGIIRPILCKTGVVSCKNDKKILDLMKYKGFNPNYSRPSKTTISHSRAKKLAKKIKEAGGFFNDDEGGFYSVLEEIGSADNLSLVARMFSAKKYGSLAEYVMDHLDETEEIKRVKDILNSY